MKIELPTVEARLIRRYKRFLTDVEMPSGEVLTAHCPNTGTLLGCVPEGARTILRDSQDPRRKLRYTFQTVEVDGTWVNVDTSLPNTLVAEAIEGGQVPELAGYEALQREVRYGASSRIDILLSRGEAELCYVEVKSTTLAIAGEARFPDAVTARGKKHLDELVSMVSEGHRAVIFFCVSRADVERFAPADDIDPLYGATLREAAAAGVEVLAYSTRVEPDRIELDARLEVSIPGFNG